VPFHCIQKMSSERSVWNTCAVRLLGERNHFGFKQDTNSYETLCTHFALTIV